MFAEVNEVADHGFSVSGLLVIFEFLLRMVSASEAGWPQAERGLQQCLVAGFDRAGRMRDARFANVGHVNKPVRESNRPPLDSFRRLVTAGTYHDWKLVLGSEHGCLSTRAVRRRNASVRWRLSTYQ